VYVNALKLSVLDDKGLGHIHDASMEILWTVGVRIPHAEMRRRFREAGAEVDEATEVVRIPEHLVFQCLESAGKTFTLYGRDRTRQARYGVGARNYNSIAGEALWVDDSCTRRRYATLEDVATASRLGDGLALINLVGAMADPHEVPVEYQCVAIAATQLKHTTKPIHFWFGDRASARYVLEVFAAVSGSEEEAARYPLAYPFLEPISPLKFPYDGIDLLFETARFSLPVPVGPMAQVGATAPGTLAGTLAQENAEILAGICVTQLIKPGLAVCYGGIPHAFDMRSTQLIFAGPEQALMAVAMTQLGKHYGLPVYINVGLTDSKIPDAQAGMEAGITLICGALAGADIFGHLGICGVDQASSLVMLTMQHELLGYVERIMRGVEVSDETLGLDVIRSVGHDGTFLDQMHTVQHFRQELWFPQLLDREFWPNWVDHGASTMYDRCIALKDRILREHVPEPLDEDTTKEIDKIVDAARRHLHSG
jgi:trimethylamine--corrinoid protein Co-methyltransferase